MQMTQKGEGKLECHMSSIKDYINDHRGCFKFNVIVTNVKIVMEFRFKNNLSNWAKL